MSDLNAYPFGAPLVPPTVATAPSRSVTSEREIQEWLVCGQIPIARSPGDGACGSHYAGPISCRGSRRPALPVTHRPPLEHEAQSHLNGARSRLRHTLTTGNKPEFAGDVHIWDPPIGQIEQIGELRLVPDAETFVQMERLSCRRRESRRPWPFQNSDAAVAEASDGLSRTGSIRGMRRHTVRRYAEEGRSGWG